LGTYTPKNKLILGYRNYELTNHLGNVLAVISDKNAEVVSASDYYPFGMTIESRSFSDGYRFGFNGKENDKDFGEGIQDYGMRIYDERNARFLSTDPLFKSYPWYTPYQFAGNMPIKYIDLDGLEPDENDPNYGKYVILGNEGVVRGVENTKDMINENWIARRAYTMSDVKKELKSLKDAGRQIHVAFIQSHGLPAQLMVYPDGDANFDMSNAQASSNIDAMLHFDDFNDYFNYVETGEEFFEGKSEEETKVYKEKFAIIEEIQYIFNSIEDGGTCILSACNAGIPYLPDVEDTDLLGLLDRLADGRIHIYLNQDYTNFSRGKSSGKTYILDTEISGGAFWMLGWRSIYNGEEQDTADKKAAIRLNPAGEEPYTEIEKPKDE